MEPPALETATGALPGPRRSVPLPWWGMVRAGVLVMLATAGVFYSVHFQSVNMSPGEPGRAALALLAHGEIGDPFAIPTGPTAHVSPPLTLFLAAVYGLCGGNDPAARIVLSLAATASYTLCVALCFRVCRTLTRSPLGDAVCILFASVLPLGFFALVVVARQWEQPEAGLLLMLALHAWAGRRRTRPGWRMLGTMGGLAGLLSPAILPPLLVTIVRQRWARNWSLRRVGAALAVVAVLMATWVVRNELVFSRPILTRSNFGLELAVGNNDRSAGFSAPDVYDHPTETHAEAEQVRALGEPEYMHRQFERARSWILAHPLRFMELTATRVRLTFFPDRVLLGFDPLLGAALLPVVMAFGALKLAALCVVVWRRSDVLMWLTFTVLPLAPYFLTHVSYRYGTVVLFPSICLIACAACLVREQVRARAGGRWAAARKGG